MRTQSAVLSTHAEVSSVTKRRPNILLLLPDQHRYDWVGPSPDIPVRTPNADALGREGVRFRRAFCPSPLCAPSRACLAAGREYGRCNVRNNGVDYPIEQPTFYTLLRDSGYHVAGCGKFDLHKATLRWGRDGRRLLDEWGFSDGIDNAGKWDAIHSGSVTPKDPYMRYLKRHGLLEAHATDFSRRHTKAATFPTPLPDHAYCDNYVGRNGLELMERFPEGKPWFLQVNFTGPHDPWDITKSMAGLYAGVEFPQPNRCPRFAPSTHVRIRRNYSAMVENIDRWVGIYVERLRERGELANTLIVYSSDHGEMLGDHGRWGKGVPFEPSVHIPMTAWGPGVKAGIVSDALVSLMDLTATFLECARVPVPKDMDSRSLRPLLAGTASKHRDHVLSGLNDWRMVFDGRHKLVTGFSGRKGPRGEAEEPTPPLLFNLEADPLENANIAAKAPDVVARLSRLIAAG